MVSRRIIFLTSITAIALSCFTLGVIETRRSDAALRAAYDVELQAIRSEIRTEVRLKAGREAAVPAGMTAPRANQAGRDLGAPLVQDAWREKIVAEIKQDLQNDMGLVPLQLLRDRRSSFVELYSYDSFGRANYGTAGYLGHGYFITVKHAVVALSGGDGDDSDKPDTRTIVSVKVVFQGKEIPAKVIDTGDADVEVQSGDWAIIKTRDLDLPPLRADTAYPYQFADPIFRLGNDYSKGIILSTGYVGERTGTGLVTCLTDGHPGVSGGGVLDQRGDLVGIPIGRMQGDYRFSFILPLRSEMFRKVPASGLAEPLTLAADAR